MDKRTLLGFVIIAAILFGFTWYQQHTNSKAEEARIEAEHRQFILDSIYRAEHPELLTVQDSPVESVENIGNNTMEPVVESVDTVYILENEVIKLYISSLGGSVDNALLKDYKRYGGGELWMFTEGSSRMGMTFSAGNIAIETAKVNFSLAEQSDSTLILILPVTTGQLEYHYALHPGNYMVDFRVRFVGCEPTSNIDLTWSASTNQNEKGFKNENNFTTLTYHYPGESSIEKLAYGTETKSKDIPTNVEWFGFKQQFFSAAMIAEENFANGRFKYGTYAEGSGKIKSFEASVQIATLRDKSAYGFKIFLGPNKYDVMQPYGVKLEKSIPLGGSWISWFNTGFIIPLFNWLGGWIGSFGIIILLITLIVKIIILPLTFKSYMSTAKMRTLKPELDEIAAKFPGKDQETQMKKQQATMALYKQSGVSPMGGCLPMLIQFPIIFAVFRFFPAAIELRGQSFLWADDLSAYDSILNFGFNIPMYGDHISLFALLMAVSMYFYSRISYNQTSAASPQMPGMKFMTLYLMPIMMLLWFNSYASGLTYYYFIANLLTMAQMYGFRYFVDEKKLHTRIKMTQVKNAGATKKKSRFAERMEEAMRKQKEMQRQQQAQRGGGTKGQIQGKNTTKPKKR